MVAVSLKKKKKNRKQNKKKKKKKEREIVENLLEKMSENAAKDWLKVKGGKE